MADVRWDEKGIVLPDVKYVFDDLARRLSENGEASCALILIDVDNLVGSPEIMNSVAVSLSEACSKNDLLGFFGGVRFGVLTGGFSNSVELEKLVSKLIYRINISEFSGGIRPRAVAGVATDSDSTNASEIFRFAEIALVKAEERSTGYAIFSKDFLLNEINDKAYDSYRKPKRKIQRILNYAFDAFSKSDAMGIMTKDVLAFIGEEYGFERVCIVNGNDAVGSVIGWSASHAETIDDEKCLEFVYSKYKELSTDGYCFDNGKYCLEMNQGFTVSGAICFEDKAGAQERDETELSELKTLAKMFSVYRLRSLSSMASEDELIYYKNALEENSTACMVIDADSYRVIYINRFGSMIFDDESVGAVCADNIAATLERIKNGEEDGADDRGVYHYDTFDKSTQKWLSSSIVCVRRAGGAYAFLLTVTDISAHMDNAKTKDKLTGLYTHEGFEIEAQKLIYGTDCEYDLAMFKVFNFRNINDEFGYEAGDDVLRTTAEKLVLILGENERAARPSGSRFCVLLKRGNFRILKTKLDYLFKVVEDDMIKKHPNLEISFMCGVYPINKQNYRLSTAIDGANLVVKNATSGKYLVTNVIEYYDEDISRSVEERKKVESEMVASLKNNEFEVVYQPKVSLKSGKVYGAEALIRWNRPDGSVVQPSFFVPIFEDNEFVLEMDIWVYRRVFSSMKHWQELGIELPVVSVNVSRLHLRDQNFPEKFEKLVDNYGIPHSAVEVELTESTFVKNYDRLIRIMEDIRSRGFKISIDDFGTGYSTLNLIAVMPVDVLKLDGNFFMKNQLTYKNRKVIESIIMLAKSLNLTVISEGVETDEQVEFLKSCYCDAVQGYYYYKPMSEGNFKQLLLDR